MHILIDLQGAQTGSRHRGIGRYASALAKAIVRNCGDHRITILLNAAFPDWAEQARREFSGLLSDDEFIAFTVPTPVGGLVAENNFRKEVAEYIREWAINSVAPDVVLVTSLFEGAVDDGTTSIGCLGDGVATATILYDLIPLSDPSRYLADPQSNSWYRNKLESLNRSRLLLAISDSAKREAVELLGFPADRVQAIYSAADGRFVPTLLDDSSAAEFARNIGLKRKFIMHTSAFEPRKNFEGLLRAFALLPKALRADYQLVFVAAISVENQIRIRKLSDESGLSPDELIFAGHVNDRQLIHLYSTCDLFAFPSLHEGFGLPALEAMSCGAIVVGSNVTSVPEVIGREDALFDPRSDADIARLIARALTDRNFRNDLKAHYVKQAKSFSWDRSARLALEAIEAKIALRSESTSRISVSSLLDKIASASYLHLASPVDLVDIAASISSTEKAMLEWRSGRLPVEKIAGDVAALPQSASDLKVRVLRPALAPLGPSPSILLLKLDHIGDLVISFDAFRIIRQTWPNARITLVCGPWNKALAERTELFDEVLVCNFFAEAGVDYDRDALAQQGLDAYKALQLGHFHLAIDMRYYGDSRMLLHYTDAKLRAGYASPGVELDLSLPEIPETGMMLHVGARAMALASAVAWTFGPSPRQRRELLLGGRAPIRPFESGIVVGIAPGTGNPIKAWGRQRFADLVELMGASGDYRFVLIGGPRDKADADFICAGRTADDCTNLAGMLAIDDLAPLLAGLDLFIGNDTGTTHMSAALGTPTICLFSGQSHVHSWSPMGEDVVTLRADVDCSPCYLTKIERCPNSHRCMDISPERVAAEAIALIGASQKSKAMPPRPEWAAQT